MPPRDIVHSKKLYHLLSIHLNNPWVRIYHEYEQKHQVSKLEEFQDTPTRFNIALVIGAFEDQKPTKYFLINFIIIDEINVNGAKITSNIRTR